MIPYNFNPRPYQLEFIESNKRFKIAVIHRRGGKSMTALNDQIIKTQITKGIYYYFLPTYKQAKNVIWEELVKRHVPQDAITKMNESELIVYYKNGSIQHFAGCEDINAHRGINCIDVVFDEFQMIDPRMWTEIIQPVLLENSGTAQFIGTPAGRNHFFHMLQAAKNNPDWFQIIKTVDDTKGIDPNELEKIRLTTPLSTFQQEYYCNFVEDAGSFFRRVRENIIPAVEFIQPNHFYQLGVDLAKYSDFTVITPFDLNTFKVQPQIRFNKVDWSYQKAMIEATARRYNNAVIKIDRTGLGDPIVEELVDRGLNISEEDSIVFTEKSRKMLLEHLSIMLEQNKIKIPNQEVLIEELESMQWTITDKGKRKAQVPNGQHDDCIMSLALAVSGITEPYLHFNKILNNTSTVTSDIHSAI